MVATFVPSPGQPFNVTQNKVRDSVSGSWTAIGAGPVDRAVQAHGVYWSSVHVGATLQIRDRENDVWYIFTGTSSATVQLLAIPLPLYTQFEYFDSVGSNTIIIYGIYS